jgi:Zn-finger nucleic acid-binding protein
MRGNPPLRILVACPACNLQHDASALSPGARFHCNCGQILVVGEPTSHDAAVVRCSSCGAPRQAAAATCAFCGSDFTLHEQDLSTICPTCATRISNRARFCHSCGTPISPQAVAGEETTRTCPVCEEDHNLHSRPMGEERIAILECHRCAGIWIGHSVFRHLEHSALEKEIGWNPGKPEAGHPGVDLPRSGERLYRRCPECSQLMNRTNYARRSGVIVDICTSHGVWLDHGELARILGWIREGHWTEAERRRILEDAELEAARRSAVAPGRRPMTMPAYGGGPTTLGRMIASVLEALFRR